jgi:hypothetical protein
MASDKLQFVGSLAGGFPQNVTNWSCQTGNPAEFCTAFQQIPHEDRKHIKKSQGIEGLWRQLNK